MAICAPSLTALSAWPAAGDFQLNVVPVAGHRPFSQAILAMSAPCSIRSNRSQAIM
jgi:hypothetical protein